MIRWTPTRPAPPPQPWRSREEILKAHLDSLSPDELRAVRPDYYWLRFGYEAWQRDQARKYSPNQPRVPAGNPDGGQWTSEGVSGTPSADPSRQELTDISAARRRLPGDRPLLPFPHLSPSRDSIGVPREPITIVNNAQTGNSTVDETTEKLRAILEKVVNDRPQGFGPAYGREIHTDFANAVKSADLRGIKVEQSINISDPKVRYGSPESIRTDIIQRNEAGEVLAIYDVKTGNAYLDARRVQELRAKTGASFRVPIIEMHTLRGLSLKARILRPRYYWVITLRLWNPWIRDIGDIGDQRTA